MLPARWSAMVAVAAMGATAATLTGSGAGGLHFAAGPLPVWGKLGDDV